MRLLLKLSLLLSAGLAQAQSAEDPWYLGASLGLTQVSNLYRVSSQDTANDDRVRSASLLAGVQARLGRQRWKLDTRVSQNDYQRSRDLNNLSYSGNASWDWASGARLSGQVSFGSQRSLAPFNPGNAPVTNEKNIQRSDRARASVRYGLYALWAADASVSLSKQDYSLALYDRFDNEQRSADIGLSYQPSPPLSLRVALRQSKGQFPRYRLRADGGFDVDRYTGDAVDLGLTWTASPTHQLSLRLSDSKNVYTEAAARNTRGRSGNLYWTYSPTSKLSLQTQIGRDTGDDSRLFNLGVFGSINSSNSRRYDTVQLQAVYALSAKVTLDASANVLRRELVDAFGLQSTTGRDRTTGASLGARWAFDRNGLLNCQLANDKRSGAAGFSLPYSAKSYGCSVQYVLH